MQKMFYDYVRNYHLARAEKKLAKMDKVPTEKKGKSKKNLKVHWGPVEVIEYPKESN
ncbi:unnamed protein product [Meloidogyne enterolobii]|uniref:Uncharacterized protein n=3 Tax=Meloidogyne enterolobii TaxID=390850 RepID=A0ACB1AS39_MELEN|nr:unnamed protein product [Meloidogyne enterolobii]